MSPICTVSVPWVSRYLNGIERPVWTKGIFIRLYYQMICSTQTNQQFPSHKHVTKPTINSGLRSFSKGDSLLPGSRIKLTLTLLFDVGKEYVNVGKEYVSEGPSFGAG